ncbi:hypothetical protein MVEN_01427200 [Mycena venus]|uniref:GST N-terminal domain-containing protein n=1 Tax=Mycena venus TaxID=2733690 RepID=A0A8H6XZH3_9AGAR|nr:hypothetical protein MVEN_01427200 [Mycena venus]
MIWGFLFNKMLKSLPPDNSIDTIRTSIFGPTLTMDLINNFQGTIITMKMPALRQVEIEVHTTYSPFFAGSDTTALAKIIRRDLARIHERGWLSTLAQAHCIFLLFKRHPMAILKIYGRKIATCTRHVATVLHELKVPFKLIEVDFLNGEHKTAEYLKKQPFGPIPYTACTTATPSTQTDA